MRLRNKVLAIKAAAGAKFFGIKTPLIISWLITNRCNYACKYCTDHKITGTEELNTSQVLTIIDKLSEMGTRAILFTGGEPLLREDIGTIVDHCTGKDIITGINSNGSLVQQKIDRLSNLNILTLSLDGPEEVNDLIRGKGAFQKVMQAVDAACSKGIRVRFAAVLSRYNLSFKNVDYLITKAEESNATVTFQPAIFRLLRAKGMNPITPPEEKYKQVIDYIISKKKETKHIGNSLSVLKHLQHWPDPKRMWCAGSLIYRRINEKGEVSICGAMEKPQRPLNCLDPDFKKALLKSEPVECDFCWCAARLEVNYAFSGNIHSILNLTKKAFL